MKMPLPLQDDGTLDFNNQQGFELLLGFEGMDMSGRTLWFDVSNGFRKQLTDGGQVDQKILTIAQTELEDMLNSVGQYVITDETTELHELILEGSIRVRGF